MASDYRLRLQLRVALLAGSLCAAAWLWFGTDLIATALLMAVFSVFLVWELIRTIDRTNRELTRFFQTVRYEDFTQTFQPGGTDSFSELNQAFAEVVNHFKIARAEKEEHYQYLQTVVQHIGIGLLSFKRSGEIDLYNPAARRLLRYPNPRTIRALDHVSDELVKALEFIRAGERRLVKVTTADDILHLSLYATELRLRNQQYMLVSLQNIQTELEEKEMEAWHSLIRVLTHEMMNSVTPISSLASTAHDLLRTDGRIAKDDIDDVRSALETIRRRSEGLLHFVETYRQLTKIPKPDYRIVPVAELFRDVSRLMEPELATAGITMLRSIEPDSLEVTADGDLIEQVLINLIVNAREALSGQSDGVIVLQAQLDERGRVLLSVSDSGPGIEPEVIDSIFIPFFTTKQTGSGIGLSLSRQIMRLHHGTLTVRSDQGAMTRFVLRF